MIHVDCVRTGVITALASCLWAVACGAGASEAMRLQMDGGFVQLAQLSEPAAAEAPRVVPAPATGFAPSRTEVEVGGSHESLTNNRQDWSSLYLEASHSFRERHTLFGGLRQTRRFGLDDTEAFGGLYYPVAATWTALLEGTVSAEHNVLPEFSVYAQMQKELARGLLMGLGVRHTEYTSNDVNMAVGSVEYYWSAYRAAYTYYASRVDGAGTAPAHRFQFNYYYTDRDSVGLAYTSGREVENVGPPVGLVTSDVREWALTGRHWFSRNWGVSYELLDHEQGVLYRRRGLRLGLRYQH